MNIGAKVFRAVSLNNSGHGDAGKVFRGNLKVGIALNPETPVSSLVHLMERLDSILFLSVHPGFYGQKFLPEVLDKVKELHCLHPDFESTKAAYIAQSYAAALASGIKANIWYSLTGNWRGNNLLDSELKPLPSYYAYTNVVKSLGNLSFSRELDEYPDINGFEFAGENKLVWFAWSRVMDQDLNVRPVQLNLPGTPSRIWDIYGQDVAVEGTSLTVTGIPLYIELPKP